MNNRKNTSELLKNIVIVLLVISALFLGWQSRLFGNSSVDLSTVSDIVGNLTGGSGNGSQSNPENKPTGAAIPVSIAVTGSSGTHYGVKYDTTEMKVLYGNTVNLFAEALGSALTPFEINEQTWREALTSPGVCFEYMAPVHLFVLGGWYGAETTADLRNVLARRLCVAADNGINRLYYQDENTGRFYAADTSSKTSLTSLADTYSVDNAAYAFERIGTQTFEDPYMLLMTVETQHPVIDADNPLSDENNQTKVLQLLGINENATPHYPVVNGIQYVGSNVNVGLLTDGTVNYERTDNPAASVTGIDESAAIEMARLQVSSLMGAYCGDAAVYFDSISAIGGDSYRIFFKYIIAGGRIYLNQDGYAAAVTVKNGIINKMELHFRHYSIANEKKQLMPEIQTAAAAGGAFILSYSDNGRDSLQPSWVAVSPNS